MTVATNYPAATAYRRILDPANRHNPYPYFAELCRVPVQRLDADTWLVSSHEAITRLLRDPRMSVQDRDIDTTDAPLGSDGEPVTGPFLFRDPPHHDSLREQTMYRFAPRIMGLRPNIEMLVTGLLDKRLSDQPGQLDVVAELAYPLPVGVICELLGVPPEEEPVFHSFAGRLTKALDPEETLTEQEITELAVTRREWREYLMPMIAQRIEHPGPDLISALLTDGDPSTRMTLVELGITLGMLLIAGHETTVNLVANGTLALLRHPEALARLRTDPELAAAVVEEVLRYDPPVQLTGRRATADIELDGHTIRAGEHVSLLLAAGNRDPRRFADPDAFWPERPNNAHLAFGGGVHYCFGAALARMEAQVALTVIVTRLDNPRLVDDPPPYRPNMLLRGPEQLRVAHDGITG
ncbi:cytochrome P450 [Amycolatopsis acidiphila]|uniref:Cytochrome P450 n=1 Tax=Amycolatopsis acidiphila TaxID=715473 RepID=A0A558ALD2_9PSEU|nr:cytochrome P450 [Amycolatopsis acidiphila]TVT25072.1 cytochrome P450 [Amycolatopsis acidiphila]UIJ57416.1 cytochrome P450 [Amycolatopsis acidiphila]GHG84352.1 cytochrome P450 [Amycolatopsis acidiphila]